MKLVSSRQFGEEIEFQNYTDSEYRKLRNAYDAFLKQPLTLGMFVPCDLDGNVLEEPEKWANFLEYSSVKVPNLKPELYDYAKAKERVLFDGFKICNRIESVKCVENGDFHFSYESAIKNGETVESLVKYNLTLTESAIKEIK